MFLRTKLLGYLRLATIGKKVLVYVLVVPLCFAIFCFLPALLLIKHNSSQLFLFVLIPLPLLALIYLTQEHPFGKRH